MKEGLKMKPTLQEIKIGERIVEDLVAHGLLEVVVERDEGPDLAEWSTDNEVFLEEKGIVTRTGETKICLLSDELPDWVIKVGYTYPGASVEDKDYCSIEADNYERAVEEGLDEFFAAIYEIYEVCLPEEYGCNRRAIFYIQERAEPNEEKTSSTCHDFLCSCCSCKNCDYCWEDGDDYDRLESLFGEMGRLDKLFRFVKEYKVNDLHSGNFGYTKKGKVKIIDYSGYED